MALKIIIAVVMISLALCTSSSADYSKHALKLPGRLLNIAADDLNGDGLGDVAAFCLKDNGERSVAVYHQRRDGFAASPDQAWALAKDAAAFDVGVVDGSGRRSICYISPGGIFAYTSNGRGFSEKPTVLVKSQNIFMQADPRDLPRWRFVLEGASGAAPQVVVPGIGRLLVYAANSGGRFRQTDELPLAVRTDYVEDILTGGQGPLTVSHRLPTVSLGAFGASPARDILVTWEDKADIFPANSKGYGGPVRFRPGLVGEEKGNGVEAAFVQAVDMDGDKRDDLVVTKVAGGVAQAKSIVFVYLRRKDGTFPQKPNQSIITEGVIGPKVLDINGDGRQDVVLPSIKAGINNFINMLTSKQINMTLSIYLQGKDGRLPDRPTREKAVTFKLDVSNVGLKNARPVMVFGRFAKGQASGLAVASKEDKVYIYPPDRYSVLGDNPAEKLPVDAPTEMEAMDLNGDGVDDLVMSYRKSKEKGRQVNVFLSR